MPGGIDVMKQFYDLFIFYLYIFRSGKKISKTQTCKCKSYSSTFSERIYINYFKKKNDFTKMFYVLPIFFVYIAALCSYIHPARVDKYKIFLSLARGMFCATNNG